ERSKAHWGPPSAFTAAAPLRQEGRILQLCGGEGEYTRPRAVKIGKMSAATRPDAGTWGHSHECSLKGFWRAR
ncbi:MAG: hypothetical protein E6167_01110, partial [Varibaculum cambriense]|nr:hypothetical protein [Varibaculum cambriense]